MPELSTIGISASLLLSLTSLILVVLMLTGVLGGGNSHKDAVGLAKEMRILLSRTKNAVKLMGEDEPWR